MPSVFVFTNVSDREENATFFFDSLAQGTRAKKSNFLGNNRVTGWLQRENADFIRVSGGL